ncbi:hypothetical protein [Actinophytocola sp.]|uniref:hypothetical protein n=1 Tax=Actinophytocola sp. TaxID=1872138 RepID=UPI003D6AE05A
MTWLPRALGIATAAYGAAITAKPVLPLKPSGMLHGHAPEADQEAFVRTLGVRDLASGVAMALAPGRGAMRTAIAVRVASDLGDLVVLGRVLRGPAGAHEGHGRRRRLGRAVRALRPGREEAARRTRAGRSAGRPPRRTR